MTARIRDGTPRGWTCPRDPRSPKTTTITTTSTGAGGGTSASVTARPARRSRRSSRCSRRVLLIMAMSPPRFGGEPSSSRSSLLGGRWGSQHHRPEKMLVQRERGLSLPGRPLRPFLKGVCVKSCWSRLSQFSLSAQTARSDLTASHSSGPPASTQAMTTWQGAVTDSHSSDSSSRSSRAAPMALSTASE